MPRARKTPPISARYDRTMPAALPIPRRAFTLLEIMPVVSVLAVLLLIILIALRPVANVQKSRNEVRRMDLAHIADAIVEHSRDEGMDIIALIPSTPSAIEICADAETGSCSTLLDLTALLGTYLREVPADPKASAPSHSRYFVERLKSGRLRFSAPDREPSTEAIIEVIR